MVRSIPSDNPSSALLRWVAVAVGCGEGDRPQVPSRQASRQPSAFQATSMMCREEGRLPDRGKRDHTPWCGAADHPLPASVSLDRSAWPSPSAGRLQGGVDAALADLSRPAAAMAPPATTIAAGIVRGCDGLPRHARHTMIFENSTSHCIFTPNRRNFDIPVRLKISTNIATHSLTCLLYKIFILLRKNWDICWALW